MCLPTVVECPLFGIHRVVGSQVQVGDPVGTCFVHCRLFGKKLTKLDEVRVHGEIDDQKARQFCAFPCRVPFVMREMPVDLLRAKIVQQQIQIMIAATSQSGSRRSLKLQHQASCQTGSAVDNGTGQGHGKQAAGRQQGKQTKQYRAHRRSFISLAQRIPSAPQE